MHISSEHLKIIEEIATKLAPKFRFAYYDTSDIIQEGILLGIDAISRWDGVRPLENFLYTHIRNRLGTLKRDKYYRIDSGGASKAQENKKKLLDASDITVCPQPIENKESPEVFEYIDKYLPASLRGDYLRYRDGVKLPGGRKAKLVSSLRIILEKFNG